MRETKSYAELYPDGTLKVFRRAEYFQSLKVLFGDSKAKSIRVELIVKKLYKKRSNPQNAYYYGVVVNDFVTGLKETTGQEITPTEAHELLKSNCNAIEIPNETTGEILKVGRSTTTLSTVEMEEYLDRCRRFIFDWFNITVLLPGEQSEIIFETK
jgi:hypothetical protein